MSHACVSLSNFEDYCKCSFKKNYCKCKYFFFKGASVSIKNSILRNKDVE